MHRHPQAEPFVELGNRSPQAAIPVVLFLVISVSVATLNLRLGRGDRRGAFRLAMFVFIVQMLVWLFEASHVISALDELKLFVEGLGCALYWAAYTWVGYVAIEPYVRRLWPRMLITSTRLLGGGVRDPLVSRDFLLGAVCGIYNRLLRDLSVIIPPPLFASPGAGPSWDFWIPNTLVDGRYWLGNFLVNQMYAIHLGVSALVALLLLRVVLRKRWLFLTVVTVSTALPVILSPVVSDVSSIPIAIVIGLPISLGLALQLFLILRFGVLAYSVALFVAMTLGFPITADVSSWYVDTGLVALGSVLAIALYGCFTSLSKPGLYGVP